MPNAIDVAEFILQRAGAMDTMKLQKLVYYSQAWSLVWSGAPLFEDPIEAWAGGPVVRDLFNRHRGRFHVGPNELGGDAGAVTAQQAANVAVVVDHYGQWSGQQLSDLAHSEGPWQTARQGLHPTARGNIPIDLMEMWQYYSAIAKASPS